MHAVLVPLPISKRSQEKIAEKQNNKKPVTEVAWSQFQNSSHYKEQLPSLVLYPESSWGCIASEICEIVK